MSLSLYAIHQEIISAEFRATDPTTGEFDTELFNKLTEHLDLETKALNVAKYIKSLLAEANALKDEKLKLEDRQRRANARAEAMKKYLQDNLEEGQKFKDSQAEITWRKKPDTVVLDIEPEMLSERFRVVSYSANKSEIATALKSGDPQIDEKAIGAHIQKGEKGIQIK